MKYRRPQHTRRQFLRDASGFCLALPLLPSLLPARAFAGAPATVHRPRLYWLTTNHGGALESRFFPPRDPDARTLALFANHSVSAAPLRSIADLSDPSTTTLSPVLKAPNHLLSPHRIAQLNILRGVDIPFGIGHHYGGHLGNYAHNETIGGTAFELQQQPRPTIDVPRSINYSPGRHPSTMTYHPSVNAPS